MSYNYKLIGYFSRKVINIVRKLKVLCSISIFSGFVIIIPPAFLILASVASIYIPAKAGIIENRENTQRMLINKYIFTAHCIGLYVFCLLPLHIDIGIFVVGMFVIIINSVLVSRVTELASVQRDYKRTKYNNNNNNVITRLRRTYRMYKV